MTESPSEQRPPDYLPAHPSAPIAQARKTILFVMPALKVLGGGTAVALWMLEGLKTEYDITLLTWTPAADIDLDVLNQVYGTSLSRGDFKLLGPPTVLRFAFDLLVNWKLDHDFQRVCLLYRRMQSLKSDFDIMISPIDEVDFGRRGIQYIHYPTFEHIYRSRKHLTVQRGIGARLRSLRERLRPWRILSRFSFEGMKKNCTLVNSDWTGDVVRRLYGIEPRTIFPPVAGDFPDTPWEDRKDQFVCIGRFVPHKRMEMVIEILSAVRAEGYSIQLQLIGLEWDDPVGREYYQKIRGLVHENASWVSLSSMIPRADLVQILAESRYGIHAASEEPFGIAVAEMVQAGCITFASRAGGQAEIIGHEERLLLDTVAEGAARILQVLGQPDQQTALRRHLAARKDMFSTDNFVRHIKDVVRAFEADRH